MIQLGFNELILSNLYLTCQNHCGELLATISVVNFCRNLVLTIAGNYDVVVAESTDGFLSC